MNLIFYILVFIIGAVIGSFLNVCIYRIPREKSIISPGSCCVFCGHRLNPIDLIPIFGYFIRKGRCKYCGEKFSPRYSCVEFLTGLLFLFVVMKFGLAAKTILVLIFICVLEVITFIDIDFQIIPDGLNLAGIIVGLVYSVLQNTVVSSLIGGAVGFLFFVLIAILGSVVFRKESMGGGDIKLSGALGVFLGWELLSVAIFLSFFVGGLFAIFLLAVKKKGRGDYIPFGPFMVCGAILALFFGDKMIAWYLGKFNV